MVTEVCDVALKIY